MESYVLNLFHIFVVSVLLIMLAANLKDNNRALKTITYVLTAGMVAYHTFVVAKKYKQSMPMSS